MHRRRTGLRAPARVVLGAIALGAVVLVASCSGRAQHAVPAQSSTRPPAATGKLRPMRGLAVGTLEMTFVDRSRRTAANGDVPGHPGRTLATTVLFPAPRTVSPDATGHARADRADGPYPLIVFAHGFASSGAEYRTLLERWASAGYVVAAPRFPLTSDKTAGGADAADYVNQPDDVRFVVTSMLQASARSDGALTGLIDPTAVGIAGHSLGGITTLGLAADTCCHDDRVKAAVVMSGDALTFPHGTFDYAKAPPILLVHGTADAAVGYESSVDTFNAARGPKGLLTIPAGGHGAPVDPGGKAFTSVVRATTDFFDGYLKRDPHAVELIHRDGLDGAAEIVFDAAAGSMTTVPTAPTTAPLTRRAAASTTARLRDGDSVTIHWSGYTPGKSVNIVECSSRDTLDAAACDLKHAVLLRPDPTGTGEASIMIVAGEVGNGVCDATHDDCALIVNDGGSFDPAASVRIPITFAPS